ncbi:MAG TPA: hypothetical protein VFK47_00410 [Ktedonobacteraceae bacterium]|nr:hypothetical protein [Ktedonobacteraceae bacterium]
MQWLGNTLFGSTVRRVATVVCVVALATIGGRLWIFKPAPSPFKEALTQVVFPIYYPQPMPAGFTLDTQSIQVSGGIVFYTLRATNGNTVTVTNQLPPIAMDPITTFETSLTEPEIVHTAYGNAKIGKLPGTVSGSLLTTKTWIIINSQQTDTLPRFAEIFQALRPTEK